MLKKFFNIREHIRKNFTSLVDSDDVNFQYKYKIANIFIDCIKNNDIEKYTFSKLDFPIDIVKDDVEDIEYTKIICDDFEIRYSSQNHINYTITLSKQIGNKIKQSTLSDMNDYIIADVLIKIEKDDLQITKDGKNIIDIFQIGETHIYKIFDNVICDVTTYYLLANNINYQNYKNLQNLLQENFYTNIDYNYTDEFYIEEGENADSDELIPKQFIITCKKDEQTCKFLYNNTTKTIDEIEIHFLLHKEIFITCNFHLKTCQIITNFDKYNDNLSLTSREYIFDTNEDNKQEYLYKILSDGQLITNNRNVKQRFTDFEDLAFYFTNIE
jgi:hypothetical protein